MIHLLVLSNDRRAFGCLWVPNILQSFSCLGCTACGETCTLIAVDRNRHVCVKLRLGTDRYFAVLCSSTSCSRVILWSAITIPTLSGCTIPRQRTVTVETTSSSPTLLVRGAMGIHGIQGDRSRSAWHKPKYYYGAEGKVKPGMGGCCEHPKGSLTQTAVQECNYTLLINSYEVPYPTLSKTVISISSVQGCCLSRAINNKCKRNVRLLHRTTLKLAAFRVCLSASLPTSHPEHPTRHTHTSTDAWPLKTPYLFLVWTQSHVILCCFALRPIILG